MTAIGLFVTLVSVIALCLMGIAVSELNRLGSIVCAFLSSIALGGLGATIADFLLWLYRVMP